MALFTHKVTNERKGFPTKQSGHPKIPKCGESAKILKILQINNCSTVESVLSRQFWTNNERFISKKKKEAYFGTVFMH